MDGNWALDYSFDRLVLALDGWRFGDRFVLRCILTLRVAHVEDILEEVK